MSTFAQPISEAIFNQNYKFDPQDDSWPDTAYRVVETLLSPDEDHEDYNEIFEKAYDALKNRRVLSGGRVLANAGTKYGTASLLNCYVSGVKTPDVDSMEEIMNELTRCAKILASEGGYGFCADFMRPRGAMIQGTGARSPGSVEMLNMWDQTSDTLTKGPEMERDRDDAKEKIRKGAMMVTMSMWHPDVEEFITAKQEAGRLSKFNMSVLVSDKFMQAVKSDMEWPLVFPDYEAVPQKYENEWDGHLRNWDGPTKTYDVVQARELWDTIMQSTYNRNEPGVLFVDTINDRNPSSYCEPRIKATNPCMPEFATVATPDGIVEFGDIEEGDTILSEEGETTVLKKWKTGHKKVFKYHTTAGSFIGTEDHEVFENGQKIEVGKAQKIDTCHANEAISTEISPQDVMDGLVVGDGSVHKASDNKVYLNVGESDQDYFQSEVAELIGEDSKINDFAYLIETTITEDELPKTYNRDVPERFFAGDVNTVAGFLRGLYSANGSVVNGRVTLKASSFDVIEKVQQMLSFLGIRSYYTTNNPEDVEHKNGTYRSKRAYDLNITSDRERFRDLIGFIQGYKEKTLERFCEDINPMVGKTKTHEIVEKEFLGTFDVYDIMVDNQSHSFWSGGLNVSNCSEWPMPPGGVCNLVNLVLPRYVSEDGESINFGQMEEDIFSAVRMADNVNDLTYVPTERQERELKQKRRVGLGHMGFGSLCAMMGVRYGSGDSVALASNIQRFVTNTAYRASAALAKEKDTFPLYDEEKHIASNIVQSLEPTTKRWIRAYGLRNSHLTSVQPTGNTSVLAGNVSGGIEPIFMASYTRTTEEPHLPKNVRRPKSVDFENEEIEEDLGVWEFETQGDESILRCTKDGYEEWQIHPTRGIVKDQPVRDYAIQNTDLDGSEDHIVTATELTVDEHVNVLEAFMEYIDASASKTTNVPADYPFKDFKEIYESAWATGVIKGATTYRQGSMSAVLKEDDVSTNGENEAEDETQRTSSVESQRSGVETCPECGSNNVRHTEGCIECLDCNYSGCEL